MQVIVDSLTKLKEKITDAEKSVSVLKGREQESMKRLREEFGLKSVAEAEKFLVKNDQELETLADQIQTKFEKLKGEYSW